MTPGDPQRQEEITGLIERVTFHHEETGFAVLRVKAHGHAELVTVVGSLPSVHAGQWLHAAGRWVRDREHGLQLKADTLQCTEPTSREGIEKYLGSGLVKGIGPVYARKLVEKFGEAVFSIIEQQSARLEEIGGIGPERRRKIKSAWAEQKVIRDIMVFLHSHGVGTGRAVRIYKTYGEEAVEKVRANPYALARDIPGIGFRTADTIARRLGIPADSLLRAGAALAHLLAQAMDQGHAALPRRELIEAGAGLLEVATERVEEALARQMAARELVRETVEGEELIYLPPLLRAEVGIARWMRDHAGLPPNLPPLDEEKALAWCQQQTGKSLAPQQREALGQILRSRVTIVTGGPGVGKTTLLDSVLRILRAREVRCLLCAPTGRAARRLSETTGLEARTIHRLLEYAPASGGFTRNEHRPLDTDLLVVDETSMVDLRLMDHLLRAMPQAAHLVLVGDIDQLPSVGPGMVLRHLIECGRLPVVRLTEVFRQAARSQIITTAHRVNQGLMPEPPQAGSDFHFIERQEPEAIAATLAKVVRERIPRKWGFDPLREIQILCPMNRGALGTRGLNPMLQNLLNPRRGGGAAVVEKFGWEFRPGDKVMQTRNNYDKEVYNGDIGRVSGIDPEERELRVSYEGREVVYDFGELDELTPAYAITVHKSQGSEFPVVVIPLAMAHFLLLQRNLIYTGITRGRRLVVVIGQRKAFEMAVRNHATARRYSGLAWRLSLP